MRKCCKEGLGKLCYKGPQSLGERQGGLLREVGQRIYKCLINIKTGTSLKNLVPLKKMNKMSNHLLWLTEKDI